MILKIYYPFVLIEFRQLSFNCIFIDKKGAFQNHAPFFLLFHVIAHIACFKPSSR